MGNVAMRNLYIDYLLSTNGHISSTGLSKVIENQYSHDQIYRMLYNRKIDDITLQLAKGCVSSVNQMLLPSPLAAGPG